ncbi:hypothetical protein [Kineobactrum salinum]|uniref:Uncharacterized protein n=1 Tax=Kineobactrum salinum TaxID=2708301 RepID=A0A6C0U3H0_9GAMM|nr:hypothetical protein [Kineobactrum salinum]QIB66712.1 hypothetical protein G3T16_16235 [Kineobactrum salinum]
MPKATGMSLVVAFILGVASNFAYSRSCIPEQEIFDQAEVLFSARVRGIMQEPDDVPPPPAAVVQLPIDSSFFDGVPSGDEITIEGSSSIRFTWTGTVDDLPAYYSRSWWVLYVDVIDVWRGNPRPKEIIYTFRSGLAETLGARITVGFADGAISPNLFIDSCQSVYVEDELDRLQIDIGLPIFSYPDRPLR